MINLHEEETKIIESNFFHLRQKEGRKEKFERDSLKYLKRSDSENQIKI